MKLTEAHEHVPAGFRISAIDYVKREIVLERKPRPVMWHNAGPLPALILAAETRAEMQAGDHGPAMTVDARRNPFAVDAEEALKRGVDGVRYRIVKAPFDSIGKIVVEGGKIEHAAVPRGVKSATKLARHRKVGRKAVKRGK